MKSKLIYFFMLFISGHLFFGSFGSHDLLKRQENWTQTTGVVTSTESDTYRNADYDSGTDRLAEAYLTDFFFTYEFTRDDGTVVTGSHEYRELPSDRNKPYTEGDSVDVIYNPNGPGYSLGDLPETSDYVLNTVMGFICGALFFILIGYGIYSIYRKLKYDSGKRRLL